MCACEEVEADRRNFHLEMKQGDIVNVNSAKEVPVMTYYLVNQIDQWLKQTLICPRTARLEIAGLNSLTSSHRG